MVQRWSTAAVDDAAPDAQVRQAGRRLAFPTPWSDVGATGTLLYGRCRGSGAAPYQVSVDLAGPRYKCSCPSRKFPCKHAVALLYLWAEGHVDEHGVAAAFAAEWAERASRTSGSAGSAESKTPEQLAAAEQRAAERDSRVDAGLVQLDRFLTDLVSRGLAADPAGRGRRFTEQAARMVDAQAPGVASRLRRLAVLTDGIPGWLDTMTEDLGLLRLLIRAWERRDALPHELVATVRSHLGFSVRSEEVLARPGVTDTWVVVGLRDAEEDRVSVRRVWLWGLTTELPALVLFFAAGGLPLTSNLYLGTCLEASLHFYPGRPSLRAAVGRRDEQARQLERWPLAAGSVGQARQAWQEAVAADPWIDAWPVRLAGRFAKAPDSGFGLVDAAGDSVALWGDACWHALAVGGGRECVVLGEIGRSGVLPTALVVDERLVIL